ncbi:N-acetylneuraminate synthase [Candidatus Kaiserbacteria bacterium]|nr:N-acetylneuraminate synthase [Candidatus Kaiserbacteria bacterium]
MRIGQRALEPGSPYVIAEAGVNHNGDVELGKLLIDAAREAGADAVKFQAFTVDEIITEEAPQAAYQAKNTGISESQAAMLRKLALSHDEFRTLKAYADERGIEFLATPFSIPDADFLHSLDLPAYKISSGDLTNIPLLEHIAGFGKPILLSTGMATLEEIRETLASIPVKKEVVLLQCTSEYPCPPAHANLRAIETLRDTFNVPVGFSDHTEGVDASIYAVSLGAVLIEKHFTMDKTLPGPDHNASLEPAELTKLIRRVRETIPSSLTVPEEILGNAKKEPTADELATKRLVRKGIAARRDIRKGETLSDANIFIARPEGLLLPKEWNNVLGKHAKVGILQGSSLSWDMIE